jgi:hypothetical protein
MQQAWQDRNICDNNALIRPAPEENPVEVL